MQSRIMSSLGLDAELGHFQIALMTVFLADGSVLCVGASSILHGSAHVLEAPHQCLPLHSLQQTTV